MSFDHRPDRQDRAPGLGERDLRRLFNLDVADGTRPPAELPALRPAARVCAVLAGACLGAVLPILMVVANKSAPATFALAALLATAAALLDGQGPALGRRYRTLLAGDQARVVLVVLLLFALSLAWTVDRAMTWRGLYEGVPELVFALATAAAWPLVARSRDAHWLLLGIAGAVALIAFERFAGMPLHALVHARGEAYDLKRSAIPPALLAWPALAFCLHRGQRWAAVGVFAAALAGTALAHSGSPGFALVAAALAFAAARLAPRASVAGLAALLALLVVAGAWTGTLATRFLPPAVEDALSEEHAAHRIRIWTAFEARERDRPLLGHGFDASMRVSTAPRPGDRPPDPDNALLVDNHPHDVMLQFWVELGLLGGMTAAAVLAFVLRRLDAASGASLPARAGLLVTVVGVGLVGLSAWQPWWIASIAVALLWFDLFERHRAGEV